MPRYEDRAGLLLTPTPGAKYGAAAKPKSGKEKRALKRLGRSSEAVFMAGARREWAPLFKFERWHAPFYIPFLSCVWVVARVWWNGAAGPMPLWIPLALKALGLSLIAILVVKLEIAKRLAEYKASQMLLTIIQGIALMLTFAAMCLQMDLTHS